MGKRITISFQDEVFNRIEKERGQNPFSTYVNDEFRKKFNIEKVDKRKKKLKGGKKK